MEASATLDDLMRRLETAKSLRSNWDSMWQEIAERVFPQMADFTSRRSPGEARTDVMYDATPALALQKFGAAIESFLTPRNQRWHRLEVNDEALRQDQSVREYLDAVNDLLFRVRYSPRAAFASQANEINLALGAFGTGGMLIEDDPAARTIRYKSMALSGMYLLEDQHGNVDTVIRTFPQTLRQLAQRFGEDKLPQRLKTKLQKNPDETAELVHMIAPRADYEPARLGPAGMPWRSVYALPEDRAVMREGGYKRKPFAIARYSTATNEIYGRSPGWLALSNIKVLNEQKKTVIKAGHKAVDPPLLASDDGVLAAYSTVPGAINYGGLDAQGNQLVKPLISGAKVEIGLDMMDREREVINDAFLVTLFQILVEQPQMTATEVMERSAEKAQLLAPVIGRLQSEYLGAIIDREIQILADADQLPPMPEALIEAGGQYEIEYTSPMSKAMRAADGLAIIRTLESAIPLAQADPSVLDHIKIPEAVRELWEINNAPAKLLRDLEEVEALKENRAQQAQAAQLLEAAPVVTDAAANLAKMQAGFGAPVI